jgi:hypothetical protein
VTASRTMDWTEEGRRIGVTLDAFHAVVVVGTDPVATAEVALGIARVQAVHRRVALGDLLGDAEPFVSTMPPDDDPHGLVDSFLYGVSLTRIARQVPDSGELFIMPTGTGPVDYDELFPNPRWRRLIAGFREVGALLVIAAPADAARVHELVDATDGVVIVGDAVPADVSVAQSLAWVRARRGAPTALARGAEPSEEPAALPAAPATPVAARSSRRMLTGIAGVALVALLAALVFWFARRPFASDRPSRVGVAADSPAAQAVTQGALVADSVARLRRDSVVRDSVARAGGPVPLDSFPILVPANAADSATAAAYGVLLGEYNTKAGVIMDLNGRFERVPATTYGILSSRFFQLVAGAYQNRAAADSLLRQLHARRSLAPGFGRVASFPLAFLVDSAVSPQQVAARVARFVARGQPVYALRQPDGTGRLYFGAYSTAEQAAIAAPTVREAGIVPTLVYRIGRVY